MASVRAMKRTNITPIDVTDQINDKELRQDPKTGAVRRRVARAQGKSTHSILRVTLLRRFPVKVLRSSLYSLCSSLVMSRSAASAISRSLPSPCWEGISFSCWPMAIENGRKGHGLARDCHSLSRHPDDRQPRQLGC